MPKKAINYSKLSQVSTDALRRIIHPFTVFLQQQSLSGYLLLAATCVALLLANSSFADLFNNFWQQQLHIGFGVLEIQMSLTQFVNDGLMTIFFTVVGLEIKRELIEGELSTRNKAMLPVAGALGGMIFPAIIFLAFNYGQPTQAGWAIPTATDIAFSLTVISLLKDRVPLSLKVFLTALAVVDDLGAVVIIAVFYSETIHWIWLGYGVVTIGIMYLLNRTHVRALWMYCTGGVLLWICLHHSGIHATIAGVVTALCVPYRFPNYEKLFNKHLQYVQYYSMLLGEEKQKIEPGLRDQIIEEIQKTSSQMEAPLNNLLHILHTFSSFVVMPLFALSNAGLPISLNSMADLATPLSLGIIAGLLVGKPLGITLVVYATSRWKLTTLPTDIGVKDLLCVNMLAGIGFTMSIFVTKLAYNNSNYIETAKLSILIASFAAGILGYIFHFYKKRQRM